MMKLNNIKSILPNWLEKEMIVTGTDKCQILDFPFLDIDNDYLRLYLIDKGNDLYITDDGEAFSALWEKTSGMQQQQYVSFYEESFKRLVSTLPLVEFNENTKEIYKNCSSSDDLGFVITMMIEAVIRCVSVTVMTSFKQDVKKKTENFKKSFENNYLIKNGCSYEPNPTARGKELEAHIFDFLVMGRQSNYVRILDNRESQTKKALLYDWKDVVDYEKLPPLVAISKSGEPKNPKNRTENERLSRIIRSNNILVFSEAEDRQKIENYFSSNKAS